MGVVIIIKELMGVSRALSSSLESLDHAMSDTELLQPPQESEKLSILVCGRSGVGKSSLVNSLVGRDVCQIGDPGLAVDEDEDEDSLGACTKLTKESRLELGNGIQISIYDSPGLQDGTNDEEAYLDDMYTKCKDVDLVLYCMEMNDPRFRREEARAIDMITRRFGPAVWKRCVLVLTKANLVRVNTKYAKTPALYHENLFKNKRSKFLSVLRDSIGDKTLVSFSVVAAGHHRSNEDEQWRDRYLYFASENSKTNDPQGGGNSDGVDFIAELWVTCLETIPESSRVTFLQATASNGRIKQVPEILKMILEASNKQAHHPPENKTPEGPGQRDGTKKTPEGPGQSGGTKKTPEGPGQSGGTNKTQNNGGYKNTFSPSDQQSKRIEEAMGFWSYLFGSLAGAVAGAGAGAYAIKGAKIGAWLGSSAGPVGAGVGALAGGIVGAAGVAAVGYAIKQYSSSDTASSKKEKKE